MMLAKGRDGRKSRFFLVWECKILFVVADTISLMTRPWVTMQDGECAGKFTR